MKAIYLTLVFLFITGLSSAQKIELFESDTCYYNKSYYAIYQHFLKNDETAFLKVKFYTPDGKFICYAPWAVGTFSCQYIDTISAIWGITCGTGCYENVVCIPGRKAQVYTDVFKTNYKHQLIATFYLGKLCVIDYLLNDTIISKQIVDPDLLYKYYNNSYAFYLPIQKLLLLKDRVIIYINSEYNLAIVPEFRNKKVITLYYQ